MVKNYVKLILAFVFASNLMAQNVPNYVPTNGLVGWWPFNGNANDESGNGNHGTVKGTTILSLDRYNINNSAYIWDGTNSPIEILNSPNQNFQAGVTFSVWIYQTGVYCSSCALTSYISKGRDVNPGGIQLGLDHITQNYSFSVWGNPSPNIFFKSSKKIEFNNWVHLAATYDGNIINIYVNGKLDKTYDYKSIIPVTTENLLFGKQKGTQVFEDNFNMLGKLDDIAIYSRALTFAEITALYTSTPPCTNPSATITPQGNTTFCQGGFVNLNASTGANYTYEWYYNGQLINGATASVYQASTSGNYMVKVIDGACNATSTATTVTVNQYPSSVVNVSGNTTFCEGNSVALTAQGNGTYLWSNGATSKSITVSQAGSYGVTITSNGCVSNSNQTTITVNPNPSATITAQGNTSFCQGGFVNLVASGGTSYQWNTGSSAATISATQSDTYTVNVFNSFGCQATASQQVTVNPLPNVTLNALNQFTLKNASPIQLVANPTGGIFSGEGVQGATFTPANVSLGKKTITYNYTSPQGCSGKASSNTFVVDSIGNVCNVTKYDTVKVTKTVYDTLKVNQTIYDTVKVTKTITDTVSILKVKFKLTTGIKANQYTTMNVYPNPTSDVIIIDASDVAALNGYSYKLFDAQGKEVYNALVTNTKTEISMKTFGKAGVYILHVVDANNVSIETKQIVLE